MASLEVLFGDLAVYAVSPIALGLLVIVCALMARDTGGAAAGLTAAVVVAIDPSGLLNGVWSMSDAPATACWLGAWYFLLGGQLSGSLVAGLLAALGIAIRPVLSPLAVVLVLLALLLDAPVAAPGQWRWRHAIVFAAVASIGIGLVGWSQAALYGSAFRSGYAVETLFSASYVSTNLLTYPRIFLGLHGYVPVALLVSVPFAWRHVDARGRALVASGLALAVVNFALYLPYAPNHNWTFLRFFHPATSAMAVVGASCVVSTITRLATRHNLSMVKWAIPLLALFNIASGRPAYRLIFDEAHLQSRVALMGHYLRQTLPRQAVVLSYIHGGSIVFYTGHRTIAPVNIAGATLDRLVDALTAGGERPVLALDENIEIPTFKRLFADSTFGQLDWPPRAVFESSSRILLFDFEDRARYARGERWPTDVLR